MIDARTEAIQRRGQLGAGRRRCPLQLGPRVGRQVIVGGVAGQLGPEHRLDAVVVEEHRRERKLLGGADRRPEDKLVQRQPTVASRLVRRAAGAYLQRAAHEFAQVEAVGAERIADDASPGAPLLVEDPRTPQAGADGAAVVVVGELRERGLAIGEMEADVRHVGGLVTHLHDGILGDRETRPEVGLKPLGAAVVDFEVVAAHGVGGIALVEHPPASLAVEEGFGEAVLEAEEEGREALEGQQGGAGVAAFGGVHGERLDAVLGGALGAAGDDGDRDGAGGERLPHRLGAGQLVAARLGGARIEHRRQLLAIGRHGRIRQPLVGVADVVDDADAIGQRGVPFGADVQLLGLVEPAERLADSDALRGDVEPDGVESGLGGGGELGDEFGGVGGGDRRLGVGVRVGLEGLAFAEGHGGRAVADGGELGDGVGGAGRVAPDAVLDGVALRQAEPDEADETLLAVQGGAEARGQPGDDLRPAAVVGADVLGGLDLAVSGHDPGALAEGLAADVLVEVPLRLVDALVVVDAEVIVEVELGLPGALGGEAPAGDVVDGEERTGGGAHHHVAGAEAVTEEQRGGAAGHERLTDALAHGVVDVPARGVERVDGQPVERRPEDRQGLGDGRLGLLEGEHPDWDGTGAHAVVGDLDLGEGHAVDERPDADESLAEDIRVVPGHDELVVEPVFELGADLAELDVVPGAMVGASLGDERVEDATVESLAGAGDEVGVGLLDGDAVAVHGGPVLGEVLVPLGAGDGVAAVRGVVGGHDGAVEVAHAVVGAMAAAGVEFERHVAGEDLLAPERTHGLVAFGDHVRPARRALETVDDLPVAAILQPRERRLVEELVDDVAARDAAPRQLRDAHALDAHARPERPQRLRQRLAHEDVLADDNPELMALGMEGVVEGVDALALRWGEREGADERLGAVGLGQPQHERVAVDGDGDGAVRLVVGDGEMEVGAGDAGHGHAEVAEEVTLVPEGVALAGDPLSLGRGPVAHEAVVLEDGVLLLELLQDAAVAVQGEIAGGQGGAGGGDQAIRARQRVRQGVDEDGAAVLEKTDQALLGGVGHEGEGGVGAAAGALRGGEGQRREVAGAGACLLAEDVGLGAIGGALDGEDQSRRLVALPAGDEADVPGLAAGADIGAEDEVLAVGAAKQELGALAVGAQGDGHGVLAADVDLPGGGQAMVGEVVRRVEPRDEIGPDGDIVHADLLGRVGEHAELASRRQRLADAEQLAAVQVADDLVSVRGDAGQIPLALEQRDLRARQQLALAGALTPQAHLVHARRGTVHAQRERIELGLGGVGLLTLGGRRVTMVEDESGLAVVQLDGDGHLIVVVDLVAGGDDVVDILAAALERVEVGALVGREGGALGVGLAGLGTRERLGKRRVEVPAARLNGPGLQLVLRPLLNHEVRHEIRAGDGQELRVLADRRTRTDGDGARQHERRGDDGAQRAAHIHRPVQVTHLQQHLLRTRRHRARRHKPRRLTATSSARQHLLHRHRIGAHRHQRLPTARLRRHLHLERQRRRRHPVVAMRLPRRRRTLPAR